MKKGADHSVTILGLSVAGISSALVLRDAGYFVEIYEIEEDVALRERFLIGSTSITARSLSGMEYDELVRSTLVQTGIVLRDDLSFVNLRSRAGLSTLEFRSRLESREAQRDIQAGRFIFAPNGSLQPTKFLDRPSFSKALGFGLSLSAWSDASFFRGLKAVVIGDTAWALEQAGLAAKYARETTIFTEAEHIEADRDLTQSMNELGVELIPKASVIDIVLNSKGCVEGIIYDLAGRRYECNADGVFLAPSIAANMDLVGGIAATHLGHEGSFFVCGTPNSIAYNAHSLLTSDGVGIANRILRSA